MKQLRKVLFIAALIAVVAAGIIAFVENQQKVDKQFLKEANTNLLSYTNETSTMLDLYLAGKLTKPYLKIHTEYLNKKTLNLFEQITTMDVPPTYQTALHQTEDNALQLSQLLSSIGTKPTPDQIKKQRIQLEKTKQQLTQLQKQYE